MNIKNITRIIPVNSDEDVSEKLPLFLDRIPAGFPSPATDYVDQSINLHQYLVSHPSATFLAEVAGDSMINRHIRAGDIVVVDRSVEIANGKVIMASLNGEFTIKTFQKSPVALVPENDDYEIYLIRDGDDFEYFGTVTGLVRKVI